MKRLISFGLATVLVLGIIIVLPAAPARVSPYRIQPAEKAPPKMPPVQKKEDVPSEQSPDLWLKVIGSENIFHSDGNVGIGTKTPDSRLHVMGA
ncbi:MAG: hypothetical protein ABIH22_01800, partial [Candidatus Margulisiibacteriota bacterium]